MSAPKITQQRNIESSRSRHWLNLGHALTPLLSIINLIIILPPTPRFSRWFSLRISHLPICPSPPWFERKSELEASSHPRPSSQISVIDGTSQATANVAISIVLFYTTAEDWWRIASSVLLTRAAECKSWDPQWIYYKLQRIQMALRAVPSLACRRKSRTQRNAALT